MLRTTRACIVIAISVMMWPHPDTPSSPRHPRLTPVTPASPRHPRLTPSPPPHPVTPASPRNPRLTPHPIFKQFPCICSLRKSDNFRPLNMLENFFTFILTHSTKRENDNSRNAVYYKIIKNDNSMEFTSKSVVNFFEYKSKRSTIPRQVEIIL